MKFLDNANNVQNEMINNFISIRSLLSNLRAFIHTRMRKLESKIWESLSPKRVESNTSCTGRNTILGIFSLVP